MRHYTLGLIFNTDFSRILLIRKNSPEFMMSKLNGIGGKLEKDESPIDGLIREVEEEASIDIPCDLWYDIGTIEDSHLPRPEGRGLPRKNDEKIEILDSDNDEIIFNSVVPLHEIIEKVFS